MLTNIFDSSILLVTPDLKVAFCFLFVWFRDISCYKKVYLKNSLHFANRCWIKAQVKLGFLSCFHPSPASELMFVRLTPFPQIFLIIATRITTELTLSSLRNVFTDNCNVGGIAKIEWQKFSQHILMNRWIRPLGKALILHKEIWFDYSVRVKDGLVESHPISKAVAGRPG